MGSASHSPIMTLGLWDSIIQPVEVYFHLGDLEQTFAAAGAAPAAAQVFNYP